MPLLSDTGPWDGLPEAAVNFALCQAALVAFFLGGQDGLLSSQVSGVLWGVVVIGAAVLRCKPILGSILSFCRNGRSGSGASKMVEAESGESELDGLLRSNDNSNDVHDGENGGRLGKDAVAGTNGVGYPSSSHVIARNSKDSIASTLSGRHQIGTRNPHWFTRTWPGFEDENSDDEGADRTNGRFTASLWSPGQTSRVRPQRIRTAALRSLVVGLAAAAPWYLAFLTDWMWEAFGVAGFFFAVAEIIATACRAVFWVQLWCGQHRRVRPLWKLQPTFPEAQWPLVEVVIAHYQEPAEELAGTLRAALDLDYPPDRLIISVLDDGYFSRQVVIDDETKWNVTPGGREVEAMVRATYGRFAGDPQTPADNTTGTGNRKPAKVAVAGCDARAGSWVLELRKPAAPVVRLVARRKAANSYFKGGNLNNAIYNIFQPEASFLVILDSDMVPAEDFLQLSLPLFFKFDPVAKSTPDTTAAASISSNGDGVNNSTSSGADKTIGRWVCSWEVGMVASPQAYRNLDTNGAEDDPLNQKNESYTRRLQQRMDAVGLVHFCGTNTTFFLPALRDCLGFVTGLLSEDTPTGEKLNLLGWDNFFVDQALAVGTVKETASDTMLQRFRWMGGNGLFFLHQHQIGSFGFKRHANNDHRAARIYAAQEGIDPSKCLVDSENNSNGSSSGNESKDSSSNPLGNEFDSSRDPAFASTISLALPSVATALHEKNDHDSDSHAKSGSFTSIPVLAAVGREDRGQAARWSKAKHPIRRLVLWSIYDVGMGYMYTSTLWHVAFHALLLDSLLFSDGERPVTMQPLFGVLYSVGSFGVLLAIGPSSQVLHVLNEWFAWSWLKALAAFDVLKLAYAMDNDDLKDYGDSGGMQRSASGNLRPRTSSGSKIFAAGELESETEDETDAEHHSASDDVALVNKSKKTPLLHRSAYHHGENREASAVAMPDADSKSPAPSKPSSAGGAASSGAWNAGASLRRWLLLPPLVYYVAVAGLLLRTLAVGGRGHTSMLHDTVLRGRPEDAVGDPFAFLSPSVTTPQHVVGAFLAVLFLVHSWPIFKVSMLEVLGCKMSLGEVSTGATFALCLLCAPLFLVAGPNLVAMVEHSTIDSSGSSNIGLNGDLSGAFVGSGSSSSGHWQDGRWVPGNAPSGPPLLGPFEPLPSDAWHATLLDASATAWQSAAWLGRGVIDDNGKEQDGSHGSASVFGQWGAQEPWADLFRRKHSGNSDSSSSSSSSGGSSSHHSGHSRSGVSGNGGENGGSGSNNNAAAGEGTSVHKGRRHNHDMKGGSSSAHLSWRGVDPALQLRLGDRVYPQVRALGLDGHTLEGFEAPPLPTLSPSPLPSSLPTILTKKSLSNSDALSDVVSGISSSGVTTEEDSAVADVSSIDVVEASAVVADVSSGGGDTIGSGARRLEEDQEKSDAMPEPEGVLSPSAEEHTHEADTVPTTELPQIKPLSAQTIAQGPLMRVGGRGAEIGFTVDVSQVGCGCTAALYLVSMPRSNVALGECGEADGYCDANFVCGLGCPEVDLFEGSAYDMQVAIHACKGPKHSHVNGEKGNTPNGRGGHRAEANTKPSEDTEPKSTKEVQQQRRMDDSESSVDSSIESQQQIGDEVGQQTNNGNPATKEEGLQEEHPKGEEEEERSNDMRAAADEALAAASAAKAAAEAKFEASRPVGAKWPPGGGNGNALHPVTDQEDGYWPTCDSEGCVRKMSQHAPAGSYGPGANYTIDTNQPFRVTLRFIGHSVAIHLLPPTPVPTTSALHHGNAEASDSGTSSSNGEGMEPQAKLRQLSGDAMPMAGNHHWLRGGHGKGDHGNTQDHSTSSSSLGEEEAMEQFTLTAVEVEVSQGPERAVRLLIDDSTCLKSSALLSAATHGQAEARGAGWTRLVEMGDALHRGQRLTGSLWGSPDSVLGEGVPGADHDVCAKRLRLKDALDSYEREQAAAAAAAADSPKNASTGVDAKSTETVSSSVASASAESTVSIATPAPDVNIVADSAASNGVGYDATVEAGTSSSESSTTNKISPVEDSTQTSTVAPKEPETADSEANAASDAESTTLETIEDYNQQRPDSNPPPAPEPEQEYHPAPQPASKPPPKLPPPKAHNPPPTGGGNSPQAHPGNHGGGGGGEKCHWSNWQHKTVCGRRALMLNQASNPGWAAQMKGAWAAEYNAIIRTRSLTNINLVNNSRSIGIDDGASSSSSSGAGQFSQSSVEVNQEVSLVLDLEDEADAAAEASGQPESDPSHEVGTRARRLACKYIAWKHANVCGYPDPPPKPKKGQNKPPPEPKQEEGYCCFSGGCGGCDSVADRSNWCARTEHRCSHQCGASGFPWCPGSDPPPLPSTSSSSDAEGGAEAVAAAAAAAAEEEKTKHAREELPGHCCFSGDCGGCASVAASTNYCALGKTECEGDCEFQWCKGEDPPPPPDPVVVAKASARAEHAFEPGRCCFYGAGCGNACSAFADENNYCAAGRSACEEECGRSSGEFKWCPLSGDDAEEARATELCDENKARAAFGDISYSGF